MEKEETNTNLSLRRKLLDCVSKKDPHPCLANPRIKNLADQYNGTSDLKYRIGILSKVYREFIEFFSEKSYVKITATNKTGRSEEVIYNVYLSFEQNADGIETFTGVRFTYQYEKGKDPEYVDFYSNFETGTCIDVVGVLKELEFLFFDYLPKFDFARFSYSRASLYDSGLEF